MFLSWVGQRRTKGCYFLLPIHIIRVNYLNKIKMIGQTDGLGNDKI
jgi:hypothetical protein